MQSYPESNHLDHHQLESRMTRVINHSTVVIQGNCTGEKRLPSHAVVIRDQLARRLVFFPAV